MRGPWIAAGYYRDPKSEDRFADGWLRTGDIATISPEGYVTKTSVGKFEKKEPRRRLASGELGHRVVWAELTIATLVPSAA